VAAAVAAIVALFGAITAYANALRLARRKDRLDRINRQLGEFYGPLYALVTASNRSWDEFRNDHRPGGGAYWDQSSPPTDDEAVAWRTWITAVFMPLNRRMRDVVVTRADLITEADIPRCLLDLCAHVSAYEAILAQWERGDFHENKPPLPFPRQALNAYIPAAFSQLKLAQSELL
jgi:hypothetical protein